MTDYVTVRREDLVRHLITGYVIKSGHSYNAAEQLAREDIDELTAAAGEPVLPPLTGDQFWDVFEGMVSEQGTIHQIFALELFDALRAAASTEETS